MTGQSAQLLPPRRCCPMRGRGGFRLADGLHLATMTGPIESGLAARWKGGVLACFPACRCLPGRRGLAWLPSRESDRQNIFAAFDDGIIPEFNSATIRPFFSPARLSRLFKSYNLLSTQMRFVA